MTPRPRVGQTANYTFLIVAAAPINYSGLTRDAISLLLYKALTAKVPWSAPAHQEQQEKRVCLLFHTQFLFRLLKLMS